MLVKDVSQGTSLASLSQTVLELRQVDLKLSGKRQLWGRPATQL